MKTKLKNKPIDLGGRDINNISDAVQVSAIYKALRNTYGYPIEIKNFKVGDKKMDSILVNPLVKDNFVVANCGDYHIISSDAAVEAATGEYIDNLYIGTRIEGIDKITDDYGHKRFIEGDLTPTQRTGYTYTYTKWSLSGTHLQIVLAGTIEEGNTIYWGVICESSLPEWICNKIYATTGSYVDAKDVNYSYYGYDTAVTGKVNLQKLTGNRIAIEPYGTQIVAEHKIFFRISFDLLIDLD